MLGMADCCICTGVKNLIFHLLSKFQMLLSHLQDRDRKLSFLLVLSYSRFLEGCLLYIRILEYIA